MTPPSTEPAGVDCGGVRDAKRALRVQVLALRNGMPPAARSEAARAIVAAISSRADFNAATRLLLTLPFGSEWDSRALVATALARRKVVALPRVNTVTHALEFGIVADLERDVAPGYQGIPEPRAHCAPIAIGTADWVLVPGVAFDAGGRRIGYGGGYYDRLLPSLPATVPRIAGAFELQLVAQVPSVAHDIAVDAIVTETRTLVPVR